MANSSEDCRTPEDCHTDDWTGHRDKVSAAALIIALAVGAIGFLVIGAMTLH